VKLVIVESPKKARTIAGFLGRGYRVAASMGHVRDLPQKGLGIDVSRDFVPHYEVLPKATRPLAALRRAAAGVEGILLATDPDREGEAIAWHLVQALRLPRGRYQRITFHEISRRAVAAALAQPRDLDPHLVDAQQARRVLDRLVGYELSPLLWRKVQRGTSAGRVQSVALRMVVEREREIAAFVPREYWTIDVRLHPDPGPEAARAAGAAGAADAFLARLEQVDGQKAEIPDERTARLLEGQLREAAYRVRETGQETLSRQPPPPFTTSTLQQTAGNRLRLPARRAMALAQALYEAGLITYMRTDSVAVADAAVQATRRLVGAQFGPEYVPAAPRRYRTRTKNAQEAHEAIRPVDVARTPGAVRGTLPPDEGRLYDLIWKRMVASQMAAARYTRDVALVDGTYTPPEGGPAGGRRFLLRATATTLVFPGWLAVYGQAAGTSDASAEGAADGEPGSAAPNARLPRMTPDQPLILEDVLPAQHFTQPPPRYTEASLVKALEEAGVGRPSTYATIVSTIQDRGYVDVRQRQLHPTDLGCAATDFLVQHFPRIVDLPFTAEMESSLDEIAGGRLAWTAMLRDFYGPFSETLGQARRQTAGIRPPRAPGPSVAGASGQPPASRPTTRPGAGAGARPAGGRVARLATETPCPECGRPLVERVSQFGPFVGCSGYPACRYVHRDPGSLGRTARTSRTARSSRTARRAPQTPLQRAETPRARTPRGRPSPLTERVIPAGSRRRTAPAEGGSGRGRPTDRRADRQPGARAPAPRTTGRSPAASPRGSRSDGSRPASPAE
jgi:DNA topoisomerase I